MASKELGMIHTVNNNVQVISPASPTVQGSVDISGELTEQLQRLVRNGNFFKVVGIDMTLDTVGATGGGQISGSLRYYAPTRGRCAAYRAAFKAMATVMKNQGITMRENQMYDFRVPLTNLSQVNSGPWPNQATLDGSSGLVMCAVDGNGNPITIDGDASNGSDVTWIHNRGVKPEYTGSAGQLYNPGFDTLQQTYAAGTDFVLNDTVPFSGNADTAERDFEEIPFTLSWTPDSTDIATKWSWKPDPALYLAVLGGNIDVYVEELNVDGEAPGVNINLAVHVSGWKSVMGDPDKRKKRGRRRK